MKEKRSESFPEVINKAAFMSDEYRDLVKVFCSEMNNAINGRICTPERMAKLYPIFREINLEQDEIKAFEKEFNTEVK